CWPRGRRRPPPHHPVARDGPPPPASSSNAEPNVEVGRRPPVLALPRAQVTQLGGGRFALSLLLRRVSGMGVSERPLRAGAKSVSCPRFLLVSPVSRTHPRNERNESGRQGGPLAELVDHPGGRIRSPG